MKIKMYTDGGARGNPGPAAVGVLIRDENDQVLVEHGETIGEATNNIAEYKALITGLKQAKKLGATELNCYLDSELVVRQLNGEYKIKNFNLQKLFDEARTAEKQFSSVTYTHQRREAEGMRRADQLVNRSLDEAGGRARYR
jgi:ribonuclease HI